MSAQDPFRGLMKLGENLLLALVYVLTARLGQLLAIDPGNVTPIWIPSGIILAALLWRGLSLWPGVWLGAFAGNIWAYLDWDTFSNGRMAIFSASMNGTGDALCAVTGAWLINRTTGTSYPFRQTNHVLRFVLYGAVLGGFVSAIFGVGGLCFANFIPLGACSTVGMTWWIGDAMGVMIVTPLLLSLHQKGEKAFSSKSLLEFAILLFIGMVVSFFSLGIWTFPVLRLPLVVLVPLLIWPVFRFQDSLMFLTLFLLSFTGVLATVLGTGPFAGTDQNTGLIELQLFLMVMCLTTYILNAVLAERKVATETLLKTAISLQEAQLSLVDAERMRTVGRLAAGVAHEVKNPLAVIRLSIDYLKTKLDQDDSMISQVETRLYEAVDRANGIIMGMLDFGAPKPLSHDLIDARGIVLEAVRMTEHAMMKRHVDLEFDIPEDLPMVRADYDKCVQVLINLFLNACHAVGEQGSIYVKAQIVRLPDRKTMDSEELVDTLELTVEDSGPGIPEDVFPKLFEPFFTTKHDEGTGMGLCVARMIMHLHGGDLTAENRQEGGARFRMFWPLSAPE